MTIEEILNGMRDCEKREYITYEEACAAYDSDESVRTETVRKTLMLAINPDFESVMMLAWLAGMDAKEFADTVLRVVVTAVLDENENKNKEQS